MTRRILFTTTALALALATPALAGDGPCIPSYADRQHLLYVKTPAYAEKLEVGDFDGDGWSDVLVARLNGSTEAFEISILLNDAEKGLRDGTLEMFDGPVTRTIHPARVLLEDFNGDGRLDVFIADSGMDGPEVFPMAQNHLILSTPEGKLRDATDQLPQVLDYTHSATAADIDADGDVDIFLGNLWDNRVRPHFLINDGTGTFVRDFNRVPNDYVVTDKHSYTAVFLADLNGDKAPDLVLGDGTYWDGGPSYSYVLLNDGRGRFRPVETPLPSSAFAPGVAPSGVDVAVGFAATELDGDGNTDLLAYHTTSDWGPRDLQLLMGNGDGTFRDETDARLEQNRTEAWMKWATFLDVNHDGFLDIAGWPLGGPKLFYLNDGEGRFIPWYLPMAISELTLIDVDRDGKLDILGVWTALNGSTTEDYGYHRYLDVSCSPPHCRVYEHSSYDGEMYPVFPGASPSAVDKIGVSSMQADPGCVLTLTFGDASANETGRYEGPTDWIGDMLNDRATSAICECR